LLGKELNLEREIFEMKAIKRNVAIGAIRSLLGTLALLALMTTAAFAQEAPAAAQPAVEEAAPAAQEAAAAAPTIDTGDTAFILISAALVLFMTIPGLFLFYGGLVRSKNVLGMLMQNFVMVGLITVQ
jgi:Amt family ammonium transporter